MLLETVPTIMRIVRHAVGMMDPPLTVPQLRTLKILRDYPGTSLSVTADHLSLTLPSASKMIEHLVRRQLVLRDDAVDDRRRMTLRLTRQGELLLRSAEAEVRAQLAGHLAQFDAGELKALRETLGLLQERFPRHGLGGVVGESTKARSRAAQVIIEPRHP